MSHWYKWYPGDYQRDTNHLSFVQDAAYRRLLDAYHSTGKLSANAENLLRICRAITPEEQEAVRVVATEFFTVENGLLVQDRVERSIAEIRSITAKRSEAGKKGAAATNCRHALSKSANAPASVAANAENLLGKKSSIPEPEPDYVNPPIPPRRGDSSAVVSASQKKTRRARGNKLTFAEWTESIRANGEKAISAYRPVWEYSERTGLPREFIEIAWLRFKDKYLSGSGARKTYIDWRAAFRDHVEANYLRLWFWSEKDSQWQLTTAGVQADKAAEVAP